MVFQGADYQPSYQKKMEGVLCYLGSIPGCQHWFLLPLTLVLCHLVHIKGRLFYSQVHAVGLLGWEYLNSQLSFGELLHFDLIKMHLRCTHISWKYFCRDYLAISFHSKYLHHFSVSDCIYYKLVFSPLPLSSYYLHVDLWWYKWFQPLLSVCSLCLLVFFIKVLSSVLSWVSATDTYIKLQMTRVGRM